MQTSELSLLLRHALILFVKVFSDRCKAKSEQSFKNLQPSNLSDAMKLIK